MIYYLIWCFLLMKIDVLLFDMHCDDIAYDFPDIDFEDGLEKELNP
jgi:hypothetical protein